MNDRSRSFSSLTWPELLALAARWVLGGIFLYMGLVKAAHPVTFLKVLREYQLIESPLALNLLAAGLPWFEALCGLLLLAGVAVRGTALVAIGMLAPFTLAVAYRALTIYQAQAIPFCAIRFDCGCGAGEVVICHKLVENGILLLVAALLVRARPQRWSLRYALLRSG